MASSDLDGERVVGIRMRCALRERVARNSSIRRCPVPSPMPLRRRAVQLARLRVQRRPLGRGKESKGGALGLVRMIRS